MSQIKLGVFLRIISMKNEKDAALSLPVSATAGAFFASDRMQ